MRIRAPCGAAVAGIVFTLVALSLADQAHAVVQEPHWVLVQVNGVDWKFRVDANNIKALGSKREFWLKTEFPKGYPTALAIQHAVMDCDKDTLTEDDGSTTPINPDVAYLVSIEQFVCGSEQYRRDVERYSRNWEMEHGGKVK